jgi:predicted SAM-dependent methyltransferase
MMSDVIEYRANDYPRFQAEGFAAQFAIPYAKHVCKGIGFDVGCGKSEWAFPGSIMVDPAFTPFYDAMHLPVLEEKARYIFSSHCLEHLDDWVGVLDYWTSQLAIGGTLFLYLPHYHQEYWRPWNNRKHKHIFTPEILKDFLADRAYVNIFASERDLNDSFMVYGTK